MYSSSPRGLLDSAKKQTKSKINRTPSEMHISDKQKNFSVNKEKPGHTYTKKPVLVYPKLKHNWMSCVQTFLEPGRQRCLRWSCPGRCSWARALEVAILLPCEV